MTILQSKFESDLQGEKILGEFLQKFFYSKLNIENFFRNTPDKYNFLDNQYLGIDVTFKFSNCEYIVDEKATLHYPNGLPTFAFEIKYRKNGEWKTGWLYDTNKKTEYYLLAWPRRKNKDLNYLIIDDIKTVEVMLIKRSDLLNYLNTSYGLNKNIVEKKANKIITLNNFGKSPITHFSDIYFFYTKNLAETPINIIIKKNILKKIATFHFLIYRNTPYSQQPKYDIWLKKDFRKFQK